MNTIRLNKLLATRGVAARRKCDALIESGVVRVNGEVVTAPGTRVIESRDKITVSGRPLAEGLVHRYLMLHKPVGVITTLSDPEGRKTIRDLLPPGGRLFPVGRLDADTSGLLIVTNDGDLAHHLMHPRYGLTKFYRVLLESAPDENQIKRLAAGVEFEPGVRSAPARVRARDPVPRGAVIEIALHEGRHRQVRRMCEAVGLTVLGLHRWAYGPLRLGELARGMIRELSDAEVAALRESSARPQARRAGLTGKRPPAERPYVSPRAAASREEAPRLRAGVAATRRDFRPRSSGVTPVARGARDRFTPRPEGGAPRGEGRRFTPRPEGGAPRGEGRRFAPRPEGGAPRGEGRRFTPRPEGGAPRGEGRRLTPRPGARSAGGSPRRAEGRAFGPRPEGAPRRREGRSFASRSEGRISAPRPGARPFAAAPRRAEGRRFSPRPGGAPSSGSARRVPPRGSGFGPDSNRPSNRPSKRRPVGGPIAGRSVGGRTNRPERKRPGRPGAAPRGGPSPGRRPSSGRSGRPSGGLVKH